MRSASFFQPFWALFPSDPEIIQRFATLGDHLSEVIVRISALRLIQAEVLIENTSTVRVHQAPVVTRQLLPDGSSHFGPVHYRNILGQRGAYECPQLTKCLPSVTCHIFSYGRRPKTDLG